MFVFVFVYVFVFGLICLIYPSKRSICSFCFIRSSKRSICFFCFICPGKRSICPAEKHPRRGEREVRKNFFREPWNKGEDAAVL